MGRRSHEPAADGMEESRASCKWEGGATSQLWIGRRSHEPAVNVDGGAMSQLWMGWRSHEPAVDGMEKPICGHRLRDEFGY